MAGIGGGDTAAPVVQGSVAREAFGIGHPQTLSAASDGAIQRGVSRT